MAISLSCLRQWPPKIQAAWLGPERDQLFNWIPVALAFGIGFYFDLGHEPDMGLSLVAVGILATLAVVCRRIFLARLIILALLMAAIGLAGAEWRSLRVSAPQLEWQQWSRQVVGAIAEISDNQDQKSKLLLEDLSIAGLEQAKTPRRISLTLRTDDKSLMPGDIITVKATLMPPGPPTMPGGFNFARQAYFVGIGGVGYAVSPVTKMGRRKAYGNAWQQAFFDAVERLRHRVSATFRAEIPGASGGLVAALTTGLRDGIPERNVDDMRNSGLAHLLAIAGLHLSMVSGLVFFLVRALLALAPGLALGYPIKKWAAMAAAAVALGYLFMSGASLPTLRAFMMGGLVFAAVILDRNPISMRLLALAAIIILLIKPESLLNVSFQMSFAAVMALIAVYESLHIPFTAFHAGRGPLLGFTLRLMGGGFLICLTTMIATVATGPFSVYHFNQLALYGVIANMLAVPLTGLWILPWAILALMLMPFHLEGLAMAPLNMGADLLLQIAARVSAMPHAVVLLPGFSLLALGVMGFGGAWLCLWRSRLRFGGIFILAAGLFMAWNVPRPDILIDDRGKLMAVKGSDGSYLMSNLRSDKYAQRLWLKANGQADPKIWPIPHKPGKARKGKPANPVIAVAGDPSLACDLNRCFYTPPLVAELERQNKAPAPRILLWWGKGDMAADCQMADIVISTLAVRGQCVGPRLIIDRFDSYYYGAEALWIKPLTGGETEFRLTSAISETERRPWTNRRQAPAWLKAGRGPLLAAVRFSPGGEK